jgi:hypothetical protein
MRILRVHEFNALSPLGSWGLMGYTYSIITGVYTLCIEIQDSPHDWYTVLCWCNVMVYKEMTLTVGFQNLSSESVKAVHQPSSAEI